MNWEPYLYDCSGCGRSIDERSETLWCKVSGWEKRREQGGTNHVALRRPMDEFMCAGCMAKRLSGLDAGQTSLMDMA